MLKSEVGVWGEFESDKGQIYTRPEVVELMLTATELNRCDDFKVLESLNYHVVKVNLSLSLLIDESILIKDDVQLDSEQITSWWSKNC